MSKPVLAPRRIALLGIARVRGLEMPWAMGWATRQRRGRWRPSLSDGYRNTRGGVEQDTEKRREAGIGVL